MNEDTIKIYEAIDELVGAETVPEFQAFSEIPRLSRDMIITEKIDGTNAQIYFPDGPLGPMYIGSRRQWITPQNDNFGFAVWAFEHRAELSELGTGRHFGEWWGHGIQRNYGLDHKRFSLFNVGRWGDGEEQEKLPSCCGTVPILYKGPFHVKTVDFILGRLAAEGSVAAPGYGNPEGVVVYHIHSRTYFKKTLHGDGHKEEKQ